MSSTSTSKRCSIPSPSVCVHGRAATHAPAQPNSFSTRLEEMMQACQGRGTLAHGVREHTPCKLYNFDASLSPTSSALSTQGMKELRILLAVLCQLSSSCTRTQRRHTMHADSAWDAWQQTATSCWKTAAGQCSRKNAHTKQVSPDGCTSKHEHTTHLHLLPNNNSSMATQQKAAQGQKTTGLGLATATCATHCVSPAALSSWLEKMS